MTIYKWLLVVAISSLLFSFIRFASKLLPSKWAQNPAPLLGKKLPAVIYSFTGAMSPARKESAFLHLPTYTAGMIFHLGIFSSLAVIILGLIGTALPLWLRLVLMSFAASGAICGLGILIKRASSPILRSISNLDDFVSNILVSIFQLLCAIVLLESTLMNLLLVYSSLLILYIPLGKLRHSFYFFSSRIALGFFYGSRGVWKPKPGSDEC